MPVNEILGALGSFEIALTPETPDNVIAQLGFYGHLAVIDGDVQVEDLGQGLLTAARYVGVLRGRAHPDGWVLSGSGMRFWLGDEDGKGAVLETQVSLTNATLTAAVTAVLPPAVTLGTVHALADPAKRYTGKHKLQTPRTALDVICDAFDVEYRVNGNGTVDVGRPDQLYNTAAPDTIIVRREPGTDMDLTAIAGDYDTDEAVHDYSNRIVLLGQTDDGGEIVTGTAAAPVVPYVDLLGNPVKMTRLISESGETLGSVAARAQLQLNRFNRPTRALKVSAADFENATGHVVGDAVFVHDPDSGIVDPAREVYFRGQVLHPDVVRLTEDTWPVTDRQTVAFRTQAGVWLDLTPWVVPEQPGTGEVTVGDLPKTLTRPGADTTIADRVDAARPTGADNGVPPKAPTGLTLSTVSVIDARGNDVAIITAEWTAPTQNTDNTTLTDLAQYIVQWRWTGRAPRWESTATADTLIDLLAALGLPYEVRVAAVDSAGQQSAWTATGSITAAADTTPPGAPSDPVVTSYLGQLRIAWDGLTALGGAMPADFNRVDVHVSATTGFTPSSATLTDSLSTTGVSYATAPYGAVRYVKLVAYDHNGNPSAASGQASGSTVQVGDGDVAALSVGKLTAGIMTADVTVAGRFATALTGARREVNAVGFQAWDASNNLIINLDGVNNLLTGRFRTGLPGTRRAEINPVSSNQVKIQFIAPDNKATEVSAYTGVGGAEAIRMASPIAGVSDVWNGFQAQSNELVFLASEDISMYYGGRYTNANTANGSWRVREALDRGTTASGSTPATSAKDRIYIDRFRTNVHYQTETGLEMYENALELYSVGTVLIESNSETTLRAGAANAQLIIAQGAGTAQGAHAQSMNSSNYGGGWLYIQNGATNSTGYSMHCLWYDRSIYIPIVSAGHTVGSARKTKREIVDLDRSALDVLAGARPRKYRRNGPKIGKAVDRLEIGLIAEEAPPEVMVDLDGGDEPLGLGPGVDLYALTVLNTAAINELRALIGKGKP